MNFACVVWVLLWISTSANAFAGESQGGARFVAGAPREARSWQDPSWTTLFGLMSGAVIGTSVPKGAELRGAETASPERAYLVETSRSLLKGCQVRAADGTRLYTPDGKGNYRALWTRDFAYMVENAGDLIPPDDVEAGLRYLIRGIRDDGAAPDRVRPDGVAVYVAGGEDHPLGEPNLDNAAFLVLAVDAHLQRVAPHRRRELFRTWTTPLRRAMDYVPRDAFGLVYNHPEKPHSPYGFTDTVGKTGELFFESLLYWVASRRLAYWNDHFGEGADAKAYRQRCALIEANIARLWDAEPGMFVAASKDCRQIDIWGNAYAVWLDFPLKEKKVSIINYLIRNREKVIWRGQVRHLLKGEYWQRLLTPVEHDRYQNGAYWATASGWMLWTVAQQDPGLARQMWSELIDDFKRNGVYECATDTHRQLDSYVVSAVNPLAAARRLGY